MWFCSFLCLAAAHYPSTLASLPIPDCSEERERNPPPPPAELNAKKLNAVNLARTEGAKLFKEGNYNEARELYEHAQYILHGMHEMTKEQDAQASELELIMDLNIAACFLKTKRWHDAISRCKMALNVDPQNAKAHFRWADALLGKGEVDAARAKFVEAAEYMEGKLESTYLLCWLLDYARMGMISQRTTQRLSHTLLW